LEVTPHKQTVLFNWLFSGVGLGSPEENLSAIIEAVFLYLDVCLSCQPANNVKALNELKP